MLWYMCLSYDDHLWVWGICHENTILTEGFSRPIVSRHPTIPLNIDQSWTCIQRGEPQHCGPPPGSHGIFTGCTTYNSQRALCNVLVSCHCIISTTMLKRSNSKHVYRPSTRTPTETKLLVPLNYINIFFNIKLYSDPKSNSTLFELVYQHVRFRTNQCIVSKTRQRQSFYTCIVNNKVTLLNPINDNVQVMSTIGASCNMTYDNLKPVRIPIDLQSQVHIRSLLVSIVSV
jgi:hypothetical protein